MSPHQDVTPATERVHPTRRALFAGAAGAAGVGVVAAASAPVAAAVATERWPDATRGFVTSRRGELRLDGASFRFAGTNCYYLHYKSHYMIDSVLNDAAQMGLRVVRCWAFMDGAESDGIVFQPEPGVFVEDGFEPLDYAVWKAGQLGLRLVLVLTNNWPTFGGMDWYVSTLGGSGHDDFYTSPAIKEAYRATARHVIGRRNRYTGLRYSQEPAVMTWELANEPRCQSDPSGDTLVAWADEMSRYVAGLAPRQLVAVGDEGFFGEAGNPDYPYSDYEGVDWRRLSTLPAVDYATTHCYPDHWKGELSAEDKVAWGTQWFRAHVSEAAALGVPVVVEEFGLTDASADKAPRDRAYADWTGEVEAGGGAGDQFWILTARQDDGELYADYDGFRVAYPSSTAALLSAHAAQLSAP